MHRRGSIICFTSDQWVAMRVEVDGEDDEVYYFHTDHLGSIAAVSHEYSNAHELVDSARYLPFGGMRVEPDEDLTDRGYTDHRHALDIKLLDMRARWQDPTIGRFLSPDTIVPDPANPQSLNRYAYGLGNPLRHTDPSGHIVDSPDKFPDQDICRYCRRSYWSPPNTRPNPRQIRETLGFLAVAASSLAVGSILVVDGAEALAATVSAMLGAACADSDCTNELVATRELGTRAIDALSSDGDPSNEINALINPQNIAKAEQHLRSIGAINNEWAPYNQAMLNRMSRIAGGELPATIYDLRWMTHELLEAQVVAGGVDLGRAHQLALEMQRLTAPWEIWRD